MIRRLLGWQFDFAFHDVVQVCAFRGEHRLHLQLAASEMLVTHDTLISCCEVTPTCFRNFLIDMLN